MPYEFSIPINIDEVPRRGISINRVAEKKTCLNIARRLAVNAVKRFSIDIRVRHSEKADSTAIVEGSVNATVMQRCSVTLDPIISNLSIPVALNFTEGKNTKWSTEDMDLKGSDLPEPMHRGRFDVGEILVQILAVEINPFPRKPGASLQDILEGTSNLSFDEVEDNLDNPFAQLAELKAKYEGQ